MKTTVHIKYGTKPNQKSFESNRSDCCSIGSVNEHNQIGTSLELFGEFS